MFHSSAYESRNHLNLVNLVTYCVLLISCILRVDMLLLLACQIVDLTMGHSKTICRILSLADVLHSVHGILSTQEFRPKRIVEARVKHQKA
jgi:hypothetical protein